MREPRKRVLKVVGTPERAADVVVGVTEVTGVAVALPAEDSIEVDLTGAGAGAESPAT